MLIEKVRLEGTRFFPFSFSRYDKYYQTPRVSLTGYDESDNENVRKLMESFLAKIACDRNLLVSKFINFAECIPLEVRVTEDGMCRAIDIYLKKDLACI
nr:hypothetical protein [Tanacetum cinerariifolium]